MKPCLGCGKDLETDCSFCLNCSTIVTNYFIYSIGEQLTMYNVVPNTLTVEKAVEEIHKLANVIPFHIPGPKRRM